jgi:hypothetical protein
MFLGKSSLGQVHRLFWFRGLVSLEPSVEKEVNVKVMLILQPVQL